MGLSFVSEPCEKVRTIQFVLEFQKLFAQNVSYRLILESGLELARPLEVELMLELDPDLDEDLDEERPLERFSEDSVGDTSRDPLLLQIMSWINFCHNESRFKFSYLHVLGYQVDGNSVLCSPRNDHICVFLCREAELLKGGLYQGCVLRGEDHH